MARKQYRSKRHSCALCKPNKMGWSHRFKNRERDLRDRTDREMQEARWLSRS